MSNTPVDDLFLRMRGGDQDALAEFFSRQRDRLWRVVDFRLDPRLRRRVDADDVLQQAYIDAASRLEHFQGDSATTAFVWLRMVVTQTLVDIHRAHLHAQRREAGREVFLDSPGADATSISLARQLIGQLTSPSEAAVRAETRVQLEQTLADMDPIDREVLALRHFEELTNSEVAEVLGIQQKAASIRYVRALARFRNILSTLPGFTAEEPTST
jgi:RNA polymerase sigma-70 factor (ECF subfamily)